MPVSFFKVPFNAAELGITDPRAKIMLQVETNIPEGTVVYEADNYIFFSGAAFTFQGVGPHELSLPTRTGAQADHEFKITAKVPRTGSTTGTYGPWYLPAPTATTTVPLSKWITTSTVPASWMTQATLTLQTKVDEGFATLQAKADEGAIHAAAAESAAVTASSIALGSAEAAIVAQANVPSSPIGGALSAAIAAALIDGGAP